VEAGIGYDGYYDDPYYYGEAPVVFGTVEAANGTDLTTFEWMYGFYLAPAATGMFTGDLLSGPLPPASAEIVGDFEEDLYDAEADLEFGDIVEWFDVPVPGGEVTTFEAL
jgi:hypothetical protein